MNYEKMVQKALLSVVRKALLETSQKGPQGRHHFYITFSTTFPGVDLPSYLKEQYPEDITIVLQREFWDLEVHEDSFSVTLCFHDTHERITVPFTALMSFVDPSVKFGLQFSPDENEAPSRSQESTASKDENSKIISLDLFRKK